MKTTPSMHVVAAAALCAVVVAYASSRAASSNRAGHQPPSGMNLTGTWTYNDSVSRQQNQALNPGSGGGGYGRRGGGGPGGGGPGGGPPGGAGGGGMRGMFRQIRTPIQNLSLAQSDTAVTFGTPERPELVVRTDGRARKIVWLDGNESEVKAEWTNEGLEVVRTLPDGPEIHELYSRLPNATRLIVAVEVTGGNMPRTMQFRRVYDVVPAQPAH